MWDLTAVNTTASATVNRVVGRVDAAVNINTSTALTDSYGGTGANIRGSVTTTGTDLWSSGQASPIAAAGSRYTTLGSTTALHLSTVFTDLRATNIFGGQLYVSANTGALRLGTVGTGTPTTGSQPIMNLPGYPTSTTSPFAFFFADLNAGVAGVDTLYVADDNAVRALAVFKNTPWWAVRGFPTAPSPTPPACAA